MARKGGKKGGLLRPLSPCFFLRSSRSLEQSSPSEASRRTSVSGTYLPLAIGAIYSGCKASLSLAEWTFSLKVAFARRTKGSLPGGRERPCAHRRTLKYAEFTRLDHVNTEASRAVTKAERRAPDTVRRTRASSHATDTAASPIKVAQFRNSAMPALPFFLLPTRRAYGPFTSCPSIRFVIAPP